MRFVRSINFSLRNYKFLFYGDRESSHRIHSSYEVILIRENNFKIGSIYAKGKNYKNYKNSKESIYIRVKENLFLSEKFPFIPPFPNFIPSIKSFLPPPIKISPNERASKVENSLHLPSFKPKFHFAGNIKPSVPSRISCDPFDSRREIEIEIKL